MSSMSFLSDRPGDVNLTIMNNVRSAIVTGSVQIGLIKDDNLAMIPEGVGALSQLAHQLRIDLFNYHNVIKKNLQFPLIRNQFNYAFAKGAESAYLWNLIKNGKFDFNYDMKDSLQGNAGAQVSQEFADGITAGMLLAGDVYVDFQDVLISPKFKYFEKPDVLADVISTGYFWASQIGIDFGLSKLGMN